MGKMASPDAPQVPTLQLRQVQDGGVAPFRWSACIARDSPRAVHVLLATVLLVLTERCARGVTLSRRSANGDFGARLPSRRTTARM